MLIGTISEPMNSFGRRSLDTGHGVDFILSVYTPSP